MIHKEIVGNCDSLVVHLELRVEDLLDRVGLLLYQGLLLGLSQHRLLLGTLNEGGQVGMSDYKHLYLLPSGSEQHEVLLFGSI